MTHYEGDPPNWVVVLLYILVGAGVIILAGWSWAISHI